MPDRRLDDDELGQRIAQALRAREAPRTLLLGKYRIDGRTAIDDRLERFDATRVTDGCWVSIEMPVEDAHVDPRAAHAFARTARAQCRLRHRHVLTALEWGTAADGRPFLVREAIDTETLRELMDRAGTVPWQRARSIALQIGSAVAAARDCGLAPAELSIDACVRARHDRRIDDVRLGALVELETLLPAERDERNHVLAIGRILEHLVTGIGQRGLAQLGVEGVVVPVPPRELGLVLARAMSPEPSQRYASVVQLGLAIAAIGAHGHPRPAAKPRGKNVPPPLPQRSVRARAPHAAEPEPSIAEMDAVAIDDDEVSEAAEASHETMLIANVALQPAEVVCVTAVALVPTAAPVDVPRPPPRAGRSRWTLPWVVLGLGLAAGAVHVASPAFWPGVAERALDGIEALRGQVQREPTGLAAASVLAIEEPVAPPPIPDAETPEPEAPRVEAPLPPPPTSLAAPLVPLASRSLGVPPPPPILPTATAVRGQRSQPPATKRSRPRATPIATTGDVVAQPAFDVAAPIEEKPMQHDSRSTPQASPAPDGPTPSQPPGSPPSPDSKPEIGPMGEPPGIPSPLPDPKRHDESPGTI